MLSYDVYIFDFDGTIADSSSDVWASIQYACEKCNVTLNEENMNDQEILSWPTVKLYSFLSGDSSDSAGEYFASLVKYHYRNINDFSQTLLYPKIDQILQYLSGKNRCYLASMKTETVLRKILEMKKWNIFFRNVYGTTDHKIRLKEEMIKDIIVKENAVDPEGFVYIGDSYTDITAARKNGIHTIGVCYGDGSSSKLIKAKPDYLVNTSNDLYRLIVEKTEE